MEDLSSGLGVTKPELTQGNGPSRGDLAPNWANSQISLMGRCPARHDPGPPSLPEMPSSEMRNRVVGGYVIVLVPEQGPVDSAESSTAWRPQDAGKGQRQQVTRTLTCCFSLCSYGVRTATKDNSTLSALHGHSFLAVFCTPALAPYSSPSTPCPRHLPPCTSSHKTLAPGSSSSLDTRDHVRTVHEGPAAHTPSSSRDTRPTEVDCELG